MSPQRVKQSITFGVAIVIVNLLEPIDIQDCHGITGFERVQQHLTKSAIAYPRELVGYILPAQFA